MRPGPFSEGELVVLVDPYHQRYLLRLQAGQKYSCQHGAIAHDAVIGQAEGTILRSTKDVPLVAFRPTLSDYVLKMKRGAQILYPKDLGSIFMRADVFPGARVFEAGAGSGALTLVLLRAVGPTGRVVSYEMRPEFAERARLNVVGLLGDCPNWTLRVRDVYQGIEEEPFDRALLDLPAAWEVLPQAEAALRPGGILVAFFPTIRQIEETATALERLPALRLVEIFETIERPWQARGLSVRPHQRIIGHTGFIIVARKLAAPGASPEPVEPLLPGFEGTEA